MDISYDKFDLSAGLFVLAGLIGLVVLTMLLAGPDLFDLDSITLKTYLPSTYSLKRGVPVTYLEIEVGHVKSVKLSGRAAKNEQIEVLFTLKNKYQDLITSGFSTSLGQNDVIGLISGGEIILTPPAEEDEVAQAPIQDGDTLRYKKAPALLDGLTDLPMKLERDVLPKVETFLTQINSFMTRINDPNGDILATVASFRSLATFLNDKNGAFMRSMKQVEVLADELADEKNLLMAVLHNPTLADTLDTTAANLQDLSKQGKIIAGQTQQLLGDAEQIPRTTQRFLDEELPHTREVIENLLTLQKLTLPILEDAKRITSSLVETTENLPGMVSDIESQLREMEDITQAVKNISLIRWNLEEEVRETPTVLRPVMLHDFSKRAQTIRVPLME